MRLFFSLRFVVASSASQRSAKEAKDVAMSRYFSGWGFSLVESVVGER